MRETKLLTRILCNTVNLPQIPMHRHCLWMTYKVPCKSLVQMVETIYSHQYGAAPELVTMSLNCFPFQNYLGDLCMLHVVNIMKNDGFDSKVVFSKNGCPLLLLRMKTALFTNGLSLGVRSSCSSLLALHCRSPNCSLE